MPARPCQALRRASVRLSVRQDAGLNERDSGRRDSPPAPLPPWARFAGMLYRPGAVFEDLRGRPSWFPPAVLAALAGTLAWSVHFISGMLRLASDEPDPAAYLVPVVDDLGSYALWNAVIAPVAALEYILNVLALAGGTAVLARHLRLGAEFRQVRSVVSCSLVWVVLARHLLSTIGARVQRAFDSDPLLGLLALAARRDCRRVCRRIPISVPPPARSTCWTPGTGDCLPSPDWLPSGRPRRSRWSRP